MTKPLWTSSELETVLNGTASAEFSASGISIDSRTVQEGDLFIAIAGPTHDGHSFTAEAFARGAAAAVIHKAGDHNGPTLKVTDTMKALEALGAAARNRAIRTKLIGVTGSVGKTGTKDMLGQILSDQDATHVSLASHNNHWGVPLTLARMPQDTVYAVQEMGMNHAGELSVLTSFAKPNVAVITTVGPAHLEFFDNIEAIVDAKCEIFQGLQPNGTAVLNCDHPYFGTMEKAAKAAGASNIITFGKNESADLRLISARVIAQRTEIIAHIGGQEITYSLPYIGEHWAMNSLAALGATIAVGADPIQALCTMKDIVVPAGRGAITDVQTAQGDFVLIDESYNANPQSLEAALDALASVAAMRQMYGTGRAVAVLGDMFELGQTTRAIHLGVADMIHGRAIDQFFACGDLMGLAHDALPPALQGGKADDALSLIPILAANIRPGDVVMVKGSNGMRLSKVVDALKNPETFKTAE
jgi:UDP-N-acetylmuramoyl-tripeptide--D-alanyl-D-alanine ligase